MLINKIGKYHIDFGMNCQDAGFIGNNIKFVADGCSESKHSEIGAQLAVMKLTVIPEIKDIALLTDFVHFGIFHAWPFDEVVTDLPNYTNLVRDYLLFTALMVRENADIFEVSYTGDGFIIAVRHDGTVQYIPVNTQDHNPGYYAYNYLDPERLSEHKDGVEVRKQSFSKKEYANVGVASDGIRYIVGHPDAVLFMEFETLLKAGKEVPMKLFINRNQSVFKDDITIAI